MKKNTSSGLTESPRDLLHTKMYEISSLATGVISEAEYKSKSENKWAIEGDKVVAELVGEAVICSYYEGVTFIVGSLKYTPDFMHMTQSGKIIFVEVKDSRFGRSYQASITRLKATAAKFAMFIFYEVIMKKDGWDTIPIKPR